MIVTDEGRWAGVQGALWRRGLALSERIIGRNWRRVFTLAVGLMALGVAMVVLSDGQVWDEIGTGFVGGSVVGLVFAIAQHTLDLQSVERQVADEVRLTVSSTSDLEGIDLGGADLTAVYLWRKRLRYARMDRARLVGADLRACDLGHASLRGADLREADLSDASLEGAVLDGADLSGAEVTGGLLTDARLVRARLVGARLGGQEASARVDLSGATLDDARLSGIRLPGARASFVVARRVDATGTVLRGADLSCADLRGASLNGADLRDADLSGADLRGAVLSRADLRGARLVGARLEWADLTGAVVAGADLSCADLRGAYLTNVDLAATVLTGARARTDDLARAGTVTGPGPAGLRIDETDASAGGRGSGGADGEAHGRVPPAAPRGAGGGARQGGEGVVDRLGIVAVPGLDALAVAIAVRLRRRRAGLDRVNGDLDAIHLRESHPYAGEPAHHGLPASVAVRRHPPRRRRAWAELRRRDGTVELVLHRRESTAAVVARESLPAGDSGTEAGLAGRLASALQHELADAEVFCDGGEIAAFAGWLEHPETPIGPALDEVLRCNPRNPLALVLRAFSRESSDTHAMAAAADEVRVAWAATSSGLVRALAATRLAWAQAQILLRASDTPAALARARSAGEVALRTFDGLRRERHPSDRLLVLRVKAEVANAFAEHVTEQPDDLQAGIARYRRCVRLLERRHLTVNPRIRNNLAYCLMAAAGRFTPGPGAGYAEATDQLRRLLDHYGLREDEADGVGPGADAYAGEQVVDEETRRTTVRVAAMARQAGLGKGPPADLSLRERSLRMGLANLGNLHRLDKRFDAALDCYGAALYCDPGYVEAYAERAWVHLERADRAAADADIRRALEVDVGTPQQKARILVGYVEALERVGLEAEQGPWLAEAQRRDPGSSHLSELQQRWKERFGDDER